MLMEFSESDIQRAKPIDPSYYEVEITGVSEKLSAKGDSTNYILEGKIVADAISGDTKFAGMPTPFWLFNTKAKGFAMSFFKALGVEIAAGTRVDWNAVIGKNVIVFIGNKMFEDRLVNDLQHKYAPSGSMKK